MKDLLPLFAVWDSMREGAGAGVGAGAVSHGEL